MPTLIATAGGVQIGDGSYPATVLSIEEQAPSPNTLGGDAWLKWTFHVRNSSRGGVELTTGSSLKFGPRAKARLWAEALLNRKIADGEHIALERLLPRDCVVIIRHNDRGYAYVDGLLPATGQPSATAAKPEEPDDVPF